MNELKKRVKMKKTSIILLFVIQVTSANAQTPWAKYVNNPNDKNARKVYNVNGGDTDKGLRILKQQIAKGSIASLELVIRLEISTSAGLDGEAAETMPELVSYGAGVLPQAYVDSLEKLGVKECLDIEPMGLEYVDGENRQKMYDEYLDKYNKFKNLKKSPLQRLCLKKLTSSIKDMKKLVVGVLAEPQCQEDKRLKPTVLFKKQGDNFQTSNELEKPLQWYITFDGRDLGMLSNRVVKIKNRSKGFGGWCDTPTYRPLVLVSQKNFKDPEHWKPFVPKQNSLSTLFPLFKKLVGELGTKFHYEKKDMKSFKSYKNSNGTMLLQVGFDLKGQSTEGKSKEWWSNYWFYVSKNRTKFIGTNLEVIDAGDYDNDGVSEVLFWHSAYNEDGYKLFYDSFKKSVKIYRGYH